MWLSQARVAAGRQAGAECYVALPLLDAAVVHPALQERFLEAGLVVLAQDGQLAPVEGSPYFRTCLLFFKVGVPEPCPFSLLGVQGASARKPSLRLRAPS